MTERTVRIKDNEMRIPVIGGDMVVAKHPAILGLPEAVRFDLRACESDVFVTGQHFDALINFLAADRFARLHEKIEKLQKANVAFIAQEVDLQMKILRDAQARRNREIWDSTKHDAQNP